LNQISISVPDTPLGHSILRAVALATIEGTAHCAMEQDCQTTAPSMPGQEMTAAFPIGPANPLPPPQTVPGETLAESAAQQPQISNCTGAMPPVGSGEKLDVRKFPWDPRIHSSGKSILGSGAWKYLRGVDRQLIEDIEAEYVAKGYGGNYGKGQAKVVSPPLPAAGPTPPPLPAAGPTPPPLPAAGPTPPVVIDSYYKFCEALRNIGKTTLDPQVRQVIADAGISSPGLLSKPENAPKIPIIAEALGLSDA
jgi:hypothetical protein